jgi:hypothetical protein
MEEINEARSRLDEKCSRLLLEAKEERSQARQYAERLENKTREIQKLTVALRNADDEAEQERERQRILVSRLRASVCFNRICIFRVMPIGLLKILGTAGGLRNLGDEISCSSQTAQTGTQISKRGSDYKTAARGGISHH